MTLTSIITKNGWRYITCQRVLCAYIFTIPTWLAGIRTHMPRCLACLHAHVPTRLPCILSHVPACLSCLLSHVPTCLACLCAQVPTYFACLHTYLAACLACLVVTCQHILHAYLPCAPTCSRAITSNNKNKFSMSCFGKIFGTFFCLFLAK